LFRSGRLSGEFGAEFAETTVQIPKRVTMSSTPLNLKPLTTLRIAAAMWVVGYHYWPDLSAALRPALLAKGYLGVELFFVLSGFILSHVYLTSFGEGRFRFGSFIWARLARIYPVHLAVLAGLGLLIAAAARLGVHAGDQMLVWSSLPAQLTLTQAWGLAPHGGWNHPSWSISAEWFAYLSFPLFAWTAWRLRSRPRVAVAAALALLAALDLGFERLAGFSLTSATIAWGALRIVPCFALGCAVWLLWRSAPLAKAARAVASTAGFLMGVILAAALGAPDLVEVALFGGLIFSMASLTSSGSRLFTWSPGVYLGEVSFAVYMVCIPWQLMFAKAAHQLLGLPEGPLPAALWALMLIGVIPVAMLVHHMVERPARWAMRTWEASGFRLGRESKLQQRIRRILATGAVQSQQAPG
jgi:peptidoglycan/LPS O-acetylase OafA/YrhL